MTCNFACSCNFDELAWNLYTRLCMLSRECCKQLWNIEKVWIILGWKKLNMLISNDTSTWLTKWYKVYALCIFRGKTFRWCAICCSFFNTVYDQYYVSPYVPYILGTPLTGTCIDTCHIQLASNKTRQWELLFYSLQIRSYLNNESSACIRLFAETSI